MSNTTDLGFFIKEISTEGNYALVIPYSTSFKNTVEQYPAINITLTTLSSSVDINTQIASICKPFIDETLLLESTIFVNTIANMLSSSTNTIVTVPASAVQQLRNSTLNITFSANPLPPEDRPPSSTDGFSSYDEMTEAYNNQNLSATNINFVA